jgi:flavin reductase (DIM6/NTAB) family NADH-FMN oxidoreductase RutF
MSNDFDAAMAALDPALIVVTTAVNRERAGCLVGFHTQSSIEPKRFCVWLSKANHTYRVALRSSHLAVHFLTVDDLPLAQLFGTRTGDDVDKFRNLEVTAGPGDVPVLADCPHWMTVRRTTLVDDGADHVCMIGEVVAAHSDGHLEPLRLSQASHLTPGHRTEERPDPPTERADGG